MFGRREPEPIGKQHDGNTWPESVRRKISEARQLGQSEVNFHGQCATCLNRSGNTSGESMRHCVGCCYSTFNDWQPNRYQGVVAR